MAEDPPHVPLLDLSGHSIRDPCSLLGQSGHAARWRRYRRFNSRRAILGACPALPSAQANSIERWVDPARSDGGHMKSYLSHANQKQTGLRVVHIAFASLAALTATSDLADAARLR